MGEGEEDDDSSSSEVEFEDQVDSFQNTTENENAILKGRGLGQLAISDQQEFVHRRPVVRKKKKNKQSKKGIASKAPVVNIKGTEKSHLLYFIK